MAEYSNELRGVLFKNDKKQEDKHPDYKGNCEIAGVKYWVAAWIKQGEKGKFMSLSFEAKEEAKPTPKKPAKALDLDDDSDLPF